MDMQIDAFKDTSFGKAALRKIGTVSENFRLYEAGYMEEKPADFSVMKVTGAEFRAAKKGPNKGKLSILVEGTRKTVYVTKEECQREVSDEPS